MATGVALFALLLAYVTLSVKFLVSVFAVAYPTYATYLAMDSENKAGAKQVYVLWHIVFFSIGLIYFRFLQDGLLGYIRNDQRLREYSMEARRFHPVCNCLIPLICTRVHLFPPPKCIPNSQNPLAPLSLHAKVQWIGHNL